MPSDDPHAESAGQTDPRPGEAETDESGTGAFGTGELDVDIPSVKKNPLLQWILVDGNRWAVTAGILVVVGLLFVGGGVFWQDDLVTLFREELVIQTTLIALFSGIILLVSIAISVNSIVLSQEITALGDQEDEMHETFSFRDAVREQTNADLSPAHPATFLQEIFKAILANVEGLSESVSDENELLKSHVDTIKHDILTQVRDVEYRLSKADGISQVLFAGIQYDYAREIYAIRHLQVKHEETLSERQREQIDELLTTLKYFTIGREYFKTLYFKRELANLSRGLLIISFPAIVFLIYATLSIRAGLIPEFSIIGIPSIIWFVGFAFLVGITPYTLFSVYILRTSTISVRTLAAGPFILDSSDGTSLLSEDDESE